MRTAQDHQQDDQVAKRTGTLFGDGPIWAEIRRAAQDLVERPAERRTSAAAGTVVRRLTVAGEWYNVRSGTATGPGSPVVVVVLERCDRKPLADEAMLKRFRFTASEARVARLLADRLSNREIAWELDVTEHTARRHTEKVLQKLGVSRRAEVARALFVIPGVGALSACKQRRSMRE